MQYEFTASCTTLVEHDEKTKKTQLLESALSLDFGDGIDPTAYFEPNGRPNQAGTKILTDVFIQGIAGNIHNAHSTGICDSAEHLRYVIAELEKFFIMNPHKIESQQERDEREKFKDA